MWQWHAVLERPESTTQMSHVQMKWMCHWYMHPQQYGAEHGLHCPAAMGGLCVHLMVNARLSTWRSKFRCVGQKTRCDGRQLVQYSFTVRDYWLYLSAVSSVSAKLRWACVSNDWDRFRPVRASRSSSSLHTLHLMMKSQTSFAVGLWKGSVCMHLLMRLSISAGHSCGTLQSLTPPRVGCSWVTISHSTSP